jgi:hypothetical protein
MENKELRPQGGPLTPKFSNPKKRSRNKFGMTKRLEPNRHVMLNLFQHLVCLFSAFGRRPFHPPPCLQGTSSRGAPSALQGEESSPESKEPTIALCDEIGQRYHDFLRGS